MGDARFSTQINICATGKSLYDLTGKLQLKEFSMQSPTENYSLNELTANINKGDIDIKSDIGEIEIRGKYQFSTIGQSMLPSSRSNCLRLLASNAIKCIVQTTISLSKQTYTILNGSTLS